MQLLVGPNYDGKKGAEESHQYVHISRLVYAHMVSSDTKSTMVKYEEEKNQCEPLDFTKVVFQNLIIFSFL